jgi:hypothetical protein
MQMCLFNYYGVTYRTKLIFRLFQHEIHLQLKEAHSVMNLVETTHKPGLMYP